MEPILVSRLRAELEEAQDALETVTSSLRFQIGDALVSALTGGGTPAAKARALLSAGQRARSLLAYSRIRRKIFSGLPHDGLPKFPASIGIGELKALEKLVSAPSNSGDAVSHAGPALSSPWSVSLAELVSEFRRAIEDGYIFDTPAQSIRLNAADQKRIVYVTQHDPEISVNGYARRTREIIRGLEARSFSVLPIVPPRSGAGDGSGNGLRAHVGALAETIKAEARRHGAGLIHSASNYLNGLAAISAARSIGIPCVYEVRGLWEETRRTLDKDFGESIGYKLQARLEVCCADNADATVIGSAGIGEELARRGAKSDRFALAESGSPDISAGQFHGGISERKLFPAGSRVLGFVGSVTSYEGFSTIAKALAMLSARDQRYRMLVVGGGPFLLEAKQLFDRAGISGRTHFTGPQPFDAAVACYQDIDLALYPRDSTRVTEIVESLKPVEALAAGVPVLVSNLQPLAALIADCPAVFASQASDAQGLARAIEDFFSRSEAERREIGAAGRAWAAEHRSWTHTVEAIEAVYKGLS